MSNKSKKNIFIKNDLFLRAQLFFYILENVINTYSSSYKLPVLSAWLLQNFAI